MLLRYHGMSEAPERVDKISMTQSIAGPARVRRRQALQWLGLILMVFCASGWPHLPASASSSQTEEIWWRNRFAEKQVELHKRTVHLVFLGDSIFHSFEWDPRAPVWNYWYGGRGAVDLGFNGDTVADVAWRVNHGELDGLSPELVVILIGTNDFGKPADAIAAAIDDLAQNVHHRLAGSKILILGLLPSGRPEADRQKARDVNAMLLERFSGPRAIANFRDISCVFFHAGQLRTDLFRERTDPGRSYPLHPTPDGMDLLAASIEPEVAAALGDARRKSASTKDTACLTGEKGAS